MISVIIPSYNRAGTIRRSVESVLNQTITDLEVIVVDDCSDDDTQNVVKGIDDTRVRYIKLDHNSGACIARNRGISEAAGDFIAFQDSDDCWMPEKLEIQLEAMRKWNADVCISSLERHKVNDDGNVSIWPTVKDLKDGPVSHDQLCTGFWVSTQTILAKKGVFEECIFDPDLKKAQDYDWAIRASRTFQFHIVSKPLVIQYLQKDSITLSGAEKMIESREYLIEKYKEEMENHPAFKLFLLKQIARGKVRLNRNASKEYAEIYRLQKNSHNLICKVLSKSGLIRLVIK